MEKSYKEHCIDALLTLELGSTPFLLQLSIKSSLPRYEISERLIMSLWSISIVSWFIAIFMLITQSMTDDHKSWKTCLHVAFASCLLSKAADILVFCV